MRQCTGCDAQYDPDHSDCRSAQGLKGRGRHRRYVRLMDKLQNLSKWQLQPRRIRCKGKALSGMKSLDVSGSFTQ
jgi:hypothetical protein